MDGDFGGVGLTGGVDGTGLGTGVGVGGGVGVVIGHLTLPEDLHSHP